MHLSRPVKGWQSLGAVVREKDWYNEWTVACVVVDPSAPECGRQGGKWSWLKAPDRVRRGTRDAGCRGKAIWSTIEGGMEIIKRATCRKTKALGIKLYKEQRSASSATSGG